MSLLPGRTIVLLPALLLVGCITTPAQKGRSPLKPARMSPDSVVLDIFFVRFPFDDPQVNGQLWQEIDEQHFPPELRRRLTANGFRVGLVGGQLPIALSELLQLSDKPVRDGDFEAGNVETGGTDEPITLDQPPQVLRRHLQLRTGRRSEILASGVYDELPVLISDRGQVCGQTYSKAQALLGVTAVAEGDGQVRLQLVPELHHDEIRQRWVGSQGMMRLKTARPRRTFDEMGISATLSPGSMLVLGSLANRPGSLGHHFFTEETDQLEQKLLLVRLSQTQHDELFCPSRELDLDVRLQE